MAKRRLVACNRCRKQKKRCEMSPLGGEAPCVCCTQVRLAHSCRYEALNGRQKAKRFQRGLEPPRLAENLDVAAFLAQPTFAAGTYTNPVKNITEPSSVFPAETSLQKRDTETNLGMLPVDRWPWEAPTATTIGPTDSQNLAFPYQQALYGTFNLSELNSSSMIFDNTSQTFDQSDFSDTFGNSLTNTASPKVASYQDANIAASSWINPSATAFQDEFFGAEYPSISAGAPGQFNSVLL